jgi:hypothetical protein
MDELRQRFEKWIASPPFEKRIARFADDPEKAAWPGSYRQIEVELAWQAWQEAARQSAGPTDEERGLKSFGESMANYQANNLRQ